MRSSDNRKVSLNNRAPVACRRRNSAAGLQSIGRQFDHDIADAQRLEETAERPTATQLLVPELLAISRS